MFTIAKFALASIFTTIYVSIFILSIFLFSPIFLLRFLLGKYLKYLNPELDSFLAPTSTLLHQPRLNVVITFLIDGRLTIEEMRETFLAKVISRKTSPDGKLQYPELQQCIHKWCGFLFWKWDRNFCIQNHIMKFRDENYEIEFRGVNEICQFMEETPMEENKSPWEIFLVENKGFTPSQKPNDNSCAVIFRFRHSLADGHSIVKLLYEALADQSLEQMPKSSILNKKETFANKLIKWIALFCYFSRNSFDLFYNHKKFFDTNDWHNGGSVDEKKFVNCVLEPISMKKAKEAQKLHGVCLPSVIIALISGALRKMMKACKVEIPEEIRICYPIPLMGHPDKLTNHFVMAEIKIPTGEHDPFKRLQQIRQNILKLKTGPVPLMIELFVQIFGRLFYWMGIWITRLRWVTMCLSNFPSPGRLKLFGKDSSDFNFINGIPNGNTGILISSIGFGDRVQMVAQIEHSLVSNLQFPGHMMSKFLEEELEALYNCTKLIN